MAARLAEMDRSSVRVHVAERAYRLSAVLRFASQAVGEIQYIRRARLRPDGDIVLADDLGDKIRDAELTLRSLSATVQKLGLEIERVDPIGQPAGRNERPAHVLDTYLERAASAAQGHEETFLCRP